MAYLNEADTCRLFVTPKLQDAGWDSAPYSIAEQRYFTDGRLVVIDGAAHRQKRKRADYILHFRRDLPLAIVEAKEHAKPAAEGAQQAKDYAAMLGLKFAYATNGREIIEIDLFKGVENTVERYPTPLELWHRRLAAATLDEQDAKPLIEPYNSQAGKNARYYQRVAVEAAVNSVIKGQRRLLLTMATGTGKTFVAFQTCWKLWSSRWNNSRQYRKPRMLYLADRNILVDDPKDKMFAPFGDARFKITGANASTSREMYFAIYQALSGGNPKLYETFPADFFDLIIVDECHRGSARADSEWRDILQYFSPATQIGMTATPLRDENRDSYEYFGNPIYSYSLRQGIADGFLAPYRVHRVITSVDAAGWRPTKDEVDRFGRPVPDDEYQTHHFERIIALRARTEAIAKHLTDLLKSTDRFAKSIIFCVDQEHALEMRGAMIRLNADLVQEYPDYVCRVTSDEGAIGLAHLSNFQDVDKPTPTILTTSQMLTTGVDAETVKNVVLAREVGSISEFKQIIGRGTRLRVDYGKDYFSIVDFTGTATAHFADHQFDGEPARIEVVTINEDGDEISVVDVTTPADDGGNTEEGTDTVNTDTVKDTEPPEPRKFYVDGGIVEVIGHLVYDLDAEGKKVHVVKYTDYSARTVRTLYSDAGQLRLAWQQPDTRHAVLVELADRGISSIELSAALNQPDTDALDLLCNLAWNTKASTRQQRAQAVLHRQPDPLATYGDEAREILAVLLDKYAERGIEQFDKISDLLQVPPLTRYGNVTEIAMRFGGVPELKTAITTLQSALFA